MSVLGPLYWSLVSQHIYIETNKHMNYYHKGAYTQCIKERPLSVQSYYSAVYSSGAVEELEGLANGAIGCGEVARGGCVLA
jgi:hypothetical protein